jgi:hypothetical protein
MCIFLSCFPHQPACWLTYLYNLLQILVWLKKGISGRVGCGLHLMSRQLYLEVGHIRPHWTFYPSTPAYNQHSFSPYITKLIVLLILLKWTSSGECIHKRGKWNATYLYCIILCQFVCLCVAFFSKSVRCESWFGKVANCCNQMCSTR